MRKFIAAIAAVFLIVGLGACGYHQTDEEKARDKANAATHQNQSTTEKRNLAERERRDEQSDRIGYVYLSSFGQPVGYYVIKGKVSNGGSQLAPEMDMVWTCKKHHGCESQVVDGPQDDGTYGAGDPGIFFFLVDGTKIETNYDYQWADKPIDLPGFSKIK